MWHKTLGRCLTLSLSFVVLSAASAFAGFGTQTLVQVNPTLQLPPNMFYTEAQATQTAIDAVADYGASIGWAFEAGSVVYQDPATDHWSFTQPYDSNDNYGWDPNPAYESVPWGAHVFDDIHSHPPDAEPGPSEEDKEELPVGVETEIIIANMGETIFTWDPDTNDLLCSGDCGGFNAQSLWEDLFQLNPVNWF